MSDTALSLRPVYRAKIHTQELMDCGFDPNAEDQGWSVLKRIMKAKGLPSWCYEDRTPFRCRMEPDGILLEFDR